jgi:hypothetical protein
MKKTKELNLTFTSRGLHQNIQDIITLKQKLKQSKTDLQRNFNEASSLKDQIGQVYYYLFYIGLAINLSDNFS